MIKAELFPEPITPDDDGWHALGPDSFRLWQWQSEGEEVAIQTIMQKGLSGLTPGISVRLI